MSCGWILALLLAVLPLFGVSDYRKFAVCLPFETSDKVSLGYVCFMMFINSLAFIIIVSCYMKMYGSVRGSQAWNSNDFRVAKRMALLVFTDFFCWAPITFFSLTAAFGYELISLNDAKVFTIFLLPLNSCANPFLYAIFTKQFKRDCSIICRRLEESTMSQSLSRSSNRVPSAMWGYSRKPSVLNSFFGCRVYKNQFESHGDQRFSEIPECLCHDPCSCTAHGMDQAPLHEAYKMKQVKPVIDIELSESDNPLVDIEPSTSSVLPDKAPKSTPPISVNYTNKTTNYHSSLYRFGNGRGKKTVCNDHARSKSKHKNQCCSNVRACATHKTSYKSIESQPGCSTAIKNNNHEYINVTDDMIIKIRQFRSGFRAEEFGQVVSLERQEPEGCDCDDTSNTISLDRSRPVKAQPSNPPDNEIVKLKHDKLRRTCSAENMPRLKLRLAEPVMQLPVTYSLPALAEHFHSRDAAPRPL